MDSDFSHPPEKIPQLLYMLDQGFDVVVNSRYVVGGGEDRSGKGGALQLILSRLLNWGIRFMLKPSFSDYTSGFVAVRRPVLRAFDLRGDYGEYFIDFIYRVIRSRKFRVCELPYIAPPRRSGSSKTGSTLGQYLRRGWKYVLTVMRLRLGVAAGI
jgi:dolichol-phosphate mannosyltransferase